jgi:putative transposase
MKQSSASTQVLSIGSKDVLTDILQQGAQRLLAVTIEAEVDQYVATHAALRDGQGHRPVVRNGHLPARSIQTGVDG